LRHLKAAHTKKAVANTLLISAKVLLASPDEQPKETIDFALNAS